jgi:catechol 2,3-dioxygenase-like lactoylglutathione lyase family enzyme
MTLRLTLVTLVVPEYDAAIAYYTGTLGFVLLEDTPLSATKRWVRVAPSPDSAAFLLAQAAVPAQQAAIGNQTGGRVAFFLMTDDFSLTYTRYQAAGVLFREHPRHEAYGWVVQFTDCYGNHWDLIGPR